MRTASRALLAALVALPPAAASAQATTYDPRYAWRTLETPHFQVHFHQGEEALARRAAGAAERAHALLAPVLDHEPRVRTQIVVSDGFDDANGLATPLPYDQIHLYAVPPESLSELNDYTDWVTSLVTHEYAHILHLDTVEGVPAFLNAVFGKILVPNGFTPSWLIEGIAVLHESPPGHGRNSSALFDMYARAIVVEGGLFALDDTSNPPLDWPLGSIPYLLGGRFLAFLQERHGDPAIAALTHDQAAQVWPYALGTMAERHLGGSAFDDLWKEFEASLRQRYESQLAEVRRRPVTALGRLTHRGARVQFPRWSPDGAFVAYWDQGLDERAGLRRVTPAGEDLGRAADVEANGAFALRSPRGALVAIADAFEEYRLQDDLYLVDLGTGRRTRVTYGERATDPDVSSDGMTAAYVARTGDGGLALRRLRLDGGPPETLFARPGTEVFSPRFSPDGRRVAFEIQEGGRRDIAVWEGGEVRRLTDDDAIDTSPAWSPDGRVVYFSSDRSGIYNVYAWADGAVRQVTNVETGAFQPDVSPDGKSLAVVTYSREGFDVATLALDPAAWLEPAPAAPRPAGDAAAPAADYPAHPYRPLQTLWPTFWLPSFASDAAGPSAGAFTAGRDVVGLNSWALDLRYAIDGRDVDYDLGYLGTWTWPGIFLGSRRTIAYVPGDSSRTESVFTPLDIQLAFPRSHLDRAFAISVGWTGTLYRARGPLSAPGSPRQTFRSLLSAGLSYSDVRRYVRSISAEEGRVLSLGIAYTNPALGGDYDYLAARAGVSQYLRVPWTRHLALALHLAAGASTGALRGGALPFSLGGIPPVDLYSVLLAAAGLGAYGAIPDQLRGYPAGIFEGTRLLSGTVELRFPLLDPRLGHSTWPVFLRRVSAAAFLDAGAVWVPDEAPGATAVPLQDRIHFGAGGELRFELVLGFHLPLDVRLGAARGLGRLLAHGIPDPYAETQVYLTLGEGF